MKKIIKALLLIICCFSEVIHATEDILIAKNSVWKFLDDGSNQVTSWNNLAFDDSNWSQGNAKLGFGDGNNATTVNNHQYPTQTGAATWYFRQTFSISNPSNYSQLKFNLLRDDGAVIYLNGVEIGRDNMPAGAIDFQTFASSTVGGGNETTYFPSLSLANTLVVGANVIAIEIHQRSSTSSDIGFNFELIGTIPDLLREPYIQSQSPTSVVLKWRTKSLEDSRVIWGTQLNLLINNVVNPALTNEHEVLLTGITPNTKIYYAIGNSTNFYVGNSQEYRIKMPPVHGTRQAFRIWVLGDSGTANANAQAVRNAYLNYQPSVETNLWLMLGDNAYNQGTDYQYQTAVFDMYPNMLKSSTLWPTIGNHDSVNANSLTETGVYYDNFVLPKTAHTDGISTGADSGTEAYYSFDYANVHFIVLNSHETNTTFRTGMINWLYNDLAVSLSDWRIALWHHPPYTKGTHNSDSESQLIYMRENIAPILESQGVDLILTGHSHAYERSWLLDGHYGISNTFNTLFHIISNQLNHYFKPILGHFPHSGTIYVVNGSSGKVGSNFTTPHPAMRNIVPLDELGSVIIDIEGDSMQVKFLNSNGQISDYFNIVKGDFIFAHGFE